MNRKNISDVLSTEDHRVTLRLVEPDASKRSHKAYAYTNKLLLVGHYGKVIAIVDRDDLFDADGNRFHHHSDA